MLINTGDSTIELKENTIIVVLGASGDLAKKKTFPALFGLVRGKIRLSLAKLTVTVPQQILTQRYQNCWICKNKDGPH